MSSSRYGELISCPVPATKTGQAPSRQYRATPSVLNILAVYLEHSSCLPGIFVRRWTLSTLRLQARGQRCYYCLWTQLWGVELPVADPGTGMEWYRFLYFPQIRNKHHHRASAFMFITRTAVGSAMRFSSSTPPTEPKLQPCFILLHYKYVNTLKVAAVASLHYRITSLGVSYYLFSIHNVWEMTYRGL